LRTLLEYDNEHDNDTDRDQHHGPERDNEHDTDLDILDRDSLQPTLAIHTFKVFAPKAVGESRQYQAFQT